MHSSTNTILKKNKLKQPRREDEVVLTIPSLTFTLRRGGVVSRDILGGAWLSPGWIFGHGNKIMFMCSALHPGGPCNH